MLFLGQLLVWIRAFGFLAGLGEHISTGNLRQSIVIDTEGKWVEFGSADHGGADLQKKASGIVPRQCKVNTRFEWYPSGKNQENAVENKNFSMRILLLFFQ